MELKMGYKQTEVGVIPEDWGISTIGDAFKLINGCAFKPSDWRLHGIPIIRIQNLNDPNASFNYYGGIIEDRHRVEPGTLLFAWSGTTGTSFGARIWNGPIGVLNQHIFKVICNEQQLNNSYSLLVLKRVQEDIEKQAHGFKASFVHVKKADLVKIPLPIPPLPEQRAIASALSDVDALLESLDRLIAKKRDIKQAAMQQLLTGKKRLPGFEGEWEKKCIGEIADCFSGGTPPTNNSSYYNGDIYWITSSELNQKIIRSTVGTISKEGLLNSSAKLVEPDTLLIALYGATAGITAITKIKAAINQAVLAILPKKDNFLFLYYKLDAIKEWIISTCTQGGQPNLSGGL